jgi:membrane-associated protein
MELFLLDAFHWTNLLQPQWYVENGGLWLLLFVVFAETGLFVGFFLPGDSLLFVAGIYAHEIKTKAGTMEPGLGNQVLNWFGFHYPNYSYWFDLLILVGLISICGIVGNAVGYWTGRKVGPAMYHWREKHGGLAVIGARFLPFIRTFAPIVAGIVKMDRKKFHFYNVVGCIAWVTTMVLGGFFLQKWILSQFGFDLKEHLEIIVLGIVLVTTAPVIIKMMSGGKKKTDAPSANDSTPQ